MRRAIILGLTIGLLWSGQIMAQTSEAKRDAMLARAKAAEISAAWTPAPGDPLGHFTVAYANEPRWAMAMR